MDIEKLLAANPAMTDIHLTEGLPLMIRVYGALKKMKEIAEPQLFAELISSYVPPDRQAAYQRTGSADSAFSLGNVRCRLHLYRSGKETWLLREILTNVAAVAHLIREGKEEQIPSYMEMGLSQMRTMKQAMYAMKGISERERERLLKSLE